MPDDEIKTRPAIEKKREWAHGDGGFGKNCNRAARPIYTAPQKIPEECRSWGCGNADWLGRGIVERDKATKKILTRDGKKVKQETNDG
ncbi:MAG TPA: hypothetical protein VMV27_07680 [Candidatus Binataceae bacterium]|nr:hypothetical protein [Candidatus Binataceae bacterium]